MERAHFESLCCEFYSQNPPFTAIAISQRPTNNLYGDDSLYFVEIGGNGDVICTSFKPKSLNFPRTRSFEITRYTKFVKRIVGSCNGLLCLVETPYEKVIHCDNIYSFPKNKTHYNNQNIWIINPLLGEYMLLPEVEGVKDIHDVIYGFGSSIDNDTYKVIRFVITYRFRDPLHELKLDGKILTVGLDDKWRDFDHSAAPHLCAHGITLNGILHWVADNGDPDWVDDDDDGDVDDVVPDSGVIYAFDIGIERGCCIPLPPGLKVDHVSLGTWDGHLCLTNHHSEFQVDIWTMKQYGNVESWTRNIIVKSWIPSDLRPYQFISITTKKNGDMLLSWMYRQNLIFCDSKIEKCRVLQLPFDGTLSMLFGYVPSFLYLGIIL